MGMNPVSSEKVRLGLIFGGRSGEHEVSLMSARSVLHAIDPARYTVTQIGITHAGRWVTGLDVLDAFAAEVDGAPASGEHWPVQDAAILGDPTWPGLRALPDAALNDGAAAALDLLAEFDVVFPLLHGTFGEDGTLQGLLELADVPYVGAGVLASAVGMDKDLFKTVMRAHGIPVVDWLTISRAEIRSDLDAALERALSLAPFPLFVKPANLGSSVGVSRCLSRSDLVEGLFEAARFDRRVLVERGIPAPREIEVSVLGNDQPQASVVGEIVPSREFYSYEAKYIDGSSELRIPAALPDEIAAEVQRLALQAYRAIDCAGMARVDFLLTGQASDPAGLYLSEINTIPGFTRISMYPKLWEASGLPYPRLIDRLVDLALERKADRDQTERRFRRGA